MMGARGSGARNQFQDRRVEMCLGERGLRLGVGMHIQFAYCTAWLVLSLVVVRMSLCRRCCPFGVVVCMEHLRPLPLPLQDLYRLLGEGVFSHDA